MRLMHSPMAAADAASIANSNNPIKDAPPSASASASAFAFANNDANNNGVNNNNNNSNGSSSSNAPLLLRCTPGDATVDYDVNATKLYEHIGDSDWKSATERCRQYPGEASTWVVRYRRDATSSSSALPPPPGDVLWRFLPIHSACALDPPTSFVRALLQCHPHGTRTLDDQGMLPLHYACGARCSREVLYLLLMSFPQAALRSDPNGMLPLHYLAQWGPSEPGAVDMVCVATGHRVGGCVDGDGNTAEMLAANAEYEGSDEVARRIRDFGSRLGGGGGGGGDCGLFLASSYIAIDNAVGGRGGAAGVAPMSPMSASSYKSRVATRNLSVQTAALTPSSGHHGGHNRHNSAPADKYSSFEDDGSEHYGEHIAGNHGGIAMFTTTTTNNNNNENNSNSWNMTPRSGRQAMDRLGVSPNNRGHYQQATGRDGGGGRMKNRRDPTPDPASMGGRATRDFSSRHSPTNGNTGADPPAAGGSRRSSSTPRSFGPTMGNDDTGTFSQRNNVAPKPATTTTFTNATITSDYGDYRGAYNPLGVNHATFSSKSNVAPASATGTTSTTAGTNATSNSRTNYIPQYGSPASSYNTTMSAVGLPPKSPRFPPTPKYSNLKDNIGDGVGGGGCQNQVQNREGREPGESDNDRQDRRLAELREELSSARIAGGGGGGSGAEVRQPNHRPPAASVRFEEDEPREPPPRGNDINAVGGGSVGHSSLRSGQSESTHDGSNSNSGHVSHLTQQLQVFDWVEKRSNDDDMTKTNERLHYVAGKTEQVVMEEMRMRASMEADKTEERDAAIHALQHEKEQREKALMEEIERLRAGKEHAEAALSKISAMGPLVKDEDTSKKEEGDQNDDDVSKLTFQNDFDHAEGVEVIVSCRVNEGISSSDTTNTNSVSSSIGSHHNDVERLMREKVEIESAIQQAIMIQRDNEVRALTNAPHVSTEQSSGITEETVNKIAMMTEQISREKKKSSELEQEIFSLKAGNQNSEEAVYNHLQEVQSLRESFDKAKVDIENYRKDAEDTLERKEKEWDKERCALLEQAAVEIEKCRGDAKDVLETKEREWNDERRILLKKIEDCTIKCASAQTEIEEYREDAKSLREGFDKAKIDIDKYRDDAERVLNTKEREWNDKQRIFEEQIKDLSDKLSLAQNDERKERALMEEDNELQWREERERLLMEIKLLKENMAAGLDSNQSMTSTIKSDSYGHTISAAGSSSSSNDNGTMVHLRMQLSNAVTEAEDMRNFNAVIRKEHDKTVEALESELKEERKCRTESLGEIVTLQYKIDMLEQELEDAKEDKKERLINLQPTPRNRGHDSHSFQSSNDSRSYHSIEEVRSLDMEVYKLKETLRLKSDEANEYRQRLDATKRMVEEKERGADLVKETLQYKISTLEQELEDAKESNKQLLVNLQPTPRNRSLDSHSFQSSHDSRSYHSIEEVRILEIEVHKLKKTLREKMDELRDQEDKHLEQLSDLNKKEQDKLKRTLREKMDDADEYRRELDEKIRELKKKHEQDLIQREDALRAELRHQEEKYLEQISNLKKKEQALMKQRDDLRSDPYSAGEIDKLVKQKDENNEKRINKIISEKDDDFKLRLKKIIEEKEEEFENDVAELEGGIRTLKEIITSKDEDFKMTVAGLEDEIKMLKKELEVGTFITDEHKKELGECKKELDRQRRKHRSEMNQLNNTLELQKSKQERLQSHIQSLEKQISDMVNDYETKLMSAYYGNVDDL